MSWKEQLGHRLVEAGHLSVGDAILAGDEPAAVLRALRARGTSSDSPAYEMVLAAAAEAQMGVIPYAEVVTRDRRVFRRCPLCGTEVEERADDVGELLSNHYAEHYDSTHADDRALRLAQRRAAIDAVARDDATHDPQL